MEPNDKPKLILQLPEKPTSGRSLLVAGFVLSFIYLALVGLYWFGRIQALTGLSPTEFGDFLAGVFAPLAFLWLVLGFLQQGRELRNSADALWLQGQELQNSVEQQRELVNVTREQLQFESIVLEQQRQEIIRNAQPILRLTQGGSMGGGQGTRLYDFQVVNHGKPCTGLAVYRDDLPSPVTTAHALPAGGKVEFRVELPSGEIVPFKVRVDYLDERLIPGNKLFSVSGANSRFNIAEESSEGPKEEST